MHCNSRYRWNKESKHAAKYLGVEMAICYKQREVANQVSSMTVIGDVKGKDVIIVDDMCDTAGTLTKAGLMVEYGANSVRAICTHGVLSGRAYERIEDSVLTEFIITDTIPLKKMFQQAKSKSCECIICSLKY